MKEKQTEVKIDRLFLLRVFEEEEKEMSVSKDFSCIGGLEKHIRIVKEMVLFPLMYGDVYAKFNLRPPRGLLFYGPPGNNCCVK